MDALTTQAKVSWTRAGDTPLQAATAFVTSVSGPVGPNQNPEGITLTVAEVPVPVLVGTPEENHAQLASIGFKLEANVLGRYFLSRDRAVELLQILQTAVEQYDTMAQSTLEQNA